MNYNFIEFHRHKHISQVSPDNDLSGPKHVVSEKPIMIFN
jgi:hypothetical protein